VAHTPAVTRRLAGLGEFLRLAWLGTLALPAALWTLVRLSWRRGPRARRALVALEAAARSREPLGPSPLEPLEPGLYRVKPEYLGSSDAAERGPTVLHLLGTAEMIYSPLIGLRALCRAEPRLARCRHVIADTPYEAAAFLGADEFSARLRRVVEPEVLRNPHGLVLLGLSRGGLVALDLGSELSQRFEDARFGVLSLAPPLCEQHPPPPTVALIGALETITEILVQEQNLWPLLRPLYRWILYRGYVRNCALVLSELEMDDVESIALFGRYLREVEPRAASLRGTREFGLLRRVSDAELRHAISGATRRASHAADKLRATVVWGLRDAWVDVPPSLERARQAAQKSGVAVAELRLHTLPDWNHGLTRSLDRDFTELARWLREAVCFVTAEAEQTAREAVTGAAS